jgi:ABC-2 type transport system permease protein
MIVMTMAMRELRSMFLSPLAWTILAVVQAILAYMFFSQIEFFMQIQPRLAGMQSPPGITEIIVVPMFGNAAIILLLIVPLLTMRLISDERRNQTLSLLFAAPLSMADIVLGKFFGAIGFLLIMVLLIILMPLSLLAGGTLDFGVMASSCLGLILLLASFTALGLYMSSLTAQPTIAAVSSFGALLLLWIIDWGSSTADALAGEGVMAYLSLVRHYEALLKGSFNSADIIYYLLFIILFLVLSTRRLDAERMQS